MNRIRTLLDSQSSSSAADFAFAELAQRIITGQIVAGSRLTEQQLAEDLGVSRTPLRAALDRLEATRMVVRQRNRSFYVSPLLLEEIRELTELRARIEGLVAFSAARNAQNPGVSMQRLMRIAHDQDNSLADAVAINRLGREFHIELMSLSGLKHVSGLLENIYLNLERYRHMLSEEEGRLADRISEHSAIAEAVKLGRAEEAEMLMRKHIQSGLDYYTTHLDLSGK